MNLPELPTRLVTIVLGFVALVFVVNVLLLDYFLVKQRGDLLDFQTRLAQLSDSFKILGGRLYTTAEITEATKSAAPTPLPIFSQTNNLACPTACVDLISLSATTAARLSTRDLVVAPTVSTTTVSQKGEFFVPLGTGTVSQLNTWVDVNTAQGSFDTNNYTSISAFYFEVVMHIPSSQGEVRARLFDTTTPFIYAGEELKTTSGTGALLSVKVPLKSGSKTYKVQMYTTIDTATLDQARIRIVTQ